MALIRHIAGVPTATEQRCVRCCEVIKDKRLMCVWPGTSFLMMGKRQPIVEWDYPDAVDCVAYDPHASEDSEPWSARGYLDVNDRHPELFGDCILLRDDDGMGFALGLARMVGKDVKITISEATGPDELTEAERQALVVRYDPHGSRELTQTERQDLIVRHGGERPEWMR